MKCPECCAWSEVKETRQRGNNITYRGRKCANGHRFASYEVTGEAWLNLNPTKKRNHQSAEGAQK